MAGRKKLGQIKRELYAADARCRFCRRPLAYAEATLDHLVPLARGGRSGRENLGLACLPCNQLKGSDRADDLLELLRALLRRWRRSAERCRLWAEAGGPPWRDGYLRQAAVFDAAAAVLDVLLREAAAGRPP